jgi:GNAT superfamily N-acetyltransferase
MVRLPGRCERGVVQEGVEVREADCVIRPARAGEGPALTELAVRAKSHWGYEEAFLEGARGDLTIDEDTIGEATIWVLERAGVRLGFYGLIGPPPAGRLEWMFLEPHAIGRGYGRLMWNQAIEQASALGYSELTIESDRFAEPFYLAMGARRIGATPSPVDGAPLPLLQVGIGRAAPADAPPRDLEAR